MYTFALLVADENAVYSHELNINILQAALSLNKLGTLEFVKSDLKLIFHMPFQGFCHLNSSSAQGFCCDILDGLPPVQPPV